MTIIFAPTKHRKNTKIILRRNKRSINFERIKAHGPNAPKI